MNIRSIASIVFLSVLAGANCHAQVEPRLVDLNVVVLDKQNRPVTDLTRDDFQISDAGKAQQITFFRQNDAKGQDAADAPGRHEISNRPTGKSSGAVVVLFDLMNLGFGARGVAAGQLVKELGKVESADSLYLYLTTLNGRLTAVHGVPVGEAAAAPAGAGPWTRQIKELMDSGLRSASTIRSPDIDVFVRTQLTFIAMATLAGELSTIPGRKIIVWVTDGVPVALGEHRSDIGMPVDFTQQIRQLSQALERSDIAIYPVRQVMLGKSDEIGATSGGMGATGGNGTGLSSLATLDEFADVTGGRRNAGKDIGEAVEQAQRDLAFSYQIGYSVDPERWDNKFHKLKVSVKRNGVRLQAKTGYNAWKEAPGTHTQQAFQAMAGAPFDAEEIGLRATVEPDADSPQTAVVKLRIEPQDIALAQEGDHYTGHLRVMAASYRGDGLIASSPVMPLDLNYTASERDQALRNGIEVAEKLSARGGEARFRLMVFDRDSNAVGSVTIPAQAFRPAQP